MGHLFYFNLQSSLSFNEYPKLLATANRCAVEIGHINHSKLFMGLYCDYVSEELIHSTVLWIKEENSLNVTLDIGTCAGITLLAVLVINSTHQVRLIDIVPIISKKGKDLADVLYDVLQMKNDKGVSQISENEINMKVTAVLGDGAFIKGNEPFKSQLNKLINKQLQYIWDPLHLANVSHIAARGKISKNEINDDVDDPNEWDLDETSDDFASNASEYTTNLLRQLIRYIQKQSVKFRAGLKYTQLLMATQGTFKKPKIWSNTRMCLYEWDLVDRFLQNSSYYEVPIQYLVTAKVYCVVIFTFKIILKIVQKVDVSYEFLCDFFYQSKGNKYGEKIMFIALNVAEEFVLNGTTLQLTEKKKEYEMNQHMSYILNQVEQYIAENTYKFKLDRSEIFVRVTRLSSSADVVDYMKISVSVIKCYIKSLWKNINDRLEFTDIGYSTSFSEAPAESVFSVYERVIAGRESLSFKRASALVRVMMEGPGIATDSAKELSRKALQRHTAKSHLGERFCGVKWVPEMISNTVSKIQRKDKKQSFYFCLKMYMKVISKYY